MKGKKTGGRVKGSRNKSIIARESAIIASGETPLDYMLRVMRDEETDAERRDDMAKASALYVHPRLASIEHGGTIGFTFEDGLAEIERGIEGDIAPLARRLPALRGEVPEDQDQGSLH